MHSMQYSKPRSVAELLGYLRDDARRVALLAGGTDLLCQLRAGTIQPDLLLDLKGVSELNALERCGEELTVGAAVVLNRLLEQRELLVGYAALLAAVEQLAAPAIRNRATLVGNVTNASPCADTVPALCVIGAEVELQGPEGTRRLAVQQFITGNRQTQRGQHEIVSRVVLPPLPAGTWSGFRKRQRVRGHDLALANAALLRDPARRRLRLSIGSCAPAPVVLDLDEFFARPRGDEIIRRAQESIHPIDDVRASSRYRREMVSLMVLQLLAEMEQATR